MTAIARPQPVGVFPLPGGYLLVPSGGDDVEAARTELVAGRVPTTWPEALKVHELVHDGQLEEAAALLGDSAVERYNRFVLEPDGVDADELARSLPPEIAPLVDVVRYAVGLVDTPPEVGASDGEIAALVLAARATAMIESSRVAQGVALLRTAALSIYTSLPVLAGVLLSNAGALARDHGLDLQSAIDDLNHAVELLRESGLTVPRAEVHYQLGAAHQELSARSGSRVLHDAVDNYYCTLQLVDARTAPYLWAMANFNLATAYLTMPMVEASDQLRSGIAIQALRSALEVLTEKDYPAEWASAQVNLANALVYAPSRRQGDNLVEAVERYEEVLVLRDRDQDPLGRARLLSNQGNALAHLGVFDHAKAKLYEARYLFEEQGDHDSVMVVRSILDEIARESVPQDLPPAVPQDVAETVPHDVAETVPQDVAHDVPQDVAR